ncbi:hypothetical protein GON03_08145 [Nocardioides sp. MAH-18]|uniref:PET hydrolase/cutinase-like domain-containing protein n=1 Tax=Nocardioides agri TaxID=2682843 RepID=A0A6L6XPT2_9ACTN|nr:MULTISPECIES: dienelactone hydrolase family protein [unclassified Nocardioides]MBA2954289.1 dienelactone hydrolase family protein [Nocardioides sp. CGMCC 1.13656]MVQ49150.1 hypothetical protein [Nocardioides sp. MAH-18]
MTTLRRAALAGLSLALVATVAPVASAAGPRPAAPGGDHVPAVKHLGPKSFTKRGPFRVGETTLALPGNKAPVEVWYPARPAEVAGKPAAEYDLVDWLPQAVQALLPAGASVSYPTGGVRGVPVAPGRFPLVVFSHGYAGFRDQSTFLTSWLATWGFVVAAPDHASRDLTAVLGGADGSTTDVGDLRATITLMTKESASRRSRFHDHVDTTRVGALGHSAGGAAVVELAAVDRRVSTYIAMAGASTDRLPRVPGLILAGNADGIVSLAKLKTAYAALHGPKRLVVLAKAGHHAFSDLCEVGAGQGGLLEVADMLGFEVPAPLRGLATDGCEPPALSPTTSWPAVRQATVAQLRYVFGFDRTPAALSGLRAAFPGVVASSAVGR